MPNRLVVTNDHFDSTKTQELFIMFLKANNYKVGDKIEYFGFRKWVGENVKEYRKLNRMGEFQSVMSLGKEHYLKFYRNKYKGNL